jgi:hypothetical protein
MDAQDEAVLGDGEDMREGVIPTASSLDAEQGRYNIIKTTNLATSNVEGSFEPETGDGNLAKRQI